MGRSESRNAGEIEEEMNYICIVTDDAAEDFTHAQDWYEDRRIGLGSEFQEALDRKLAMICHLPEMNPLYFENKVRRGKLSDYPYSLYYTVNKHIVEIVALLHDHQDIMPVLRKRAT